jgi:hypothetical protein
VVVLVAALMGRRPDEPFHAVLMRVCVAAFAAHMLLLLGESASRNLDRGAYATTVYWLYARVFYAMVIAASVAWTARRMRERLDNRFTIVAVGLSAAMLAGLALMRDPAVAVMGAVAGLAIAWAADRRALDSGVDRVRRLMADDRIVVGAVFALALGVRLLYSARVMSDPNYIETGPDARFYDRIAMGFLDGRPAFDEGYPLLILGHVRFLAGIYWVFGHSYLAVCIIQSLIGAAASAAIYVIGRPVFGGAAALIAAIFTAASFPLAFWAAAIGYQSLDIGLTVLLVWLLIRGAERWPGRWWVWAVAGVTFGFAISVRETASTFLAFACLWVLWAIRDRPAAERWRAAILMGAAAVAVVVPMIAPMVSTPERRAGIRNNFDRLASGYQVTGHEGLAAPTDPAAALKQVREQPGFVVTALARGMAHNIGMQFFTQPYGAFDLVTLRKGTPYYFAVWSYAYLLTLVGAWVAIRRIYGGDPRSAALAMIVGVIVSRTLVHLYLQSGYRHRAPLEPFLILLCAAGVMAVLRDAGLTQAGDGAVEQAA